MFGEYQVIPVSTLAGVDITIGGSTRRESQVATLHRFIATCLTYIYPPSEKTLSYYVMLF